MTEIYCQGNHNSNKRELCESCADFLTYANKRIEICPVAETKTSCRKCAIHCYNQQYKEKVKSIMRFSGPRMILEHPLMAFMHLIREF